MPTTRCCWCNRPFHHKNRRKTREHLIPICLGGAVNDFTNLDFACEPCNNERSQVTNVLLARRGVYTYRANHSVDKTTVERWVKWETERMGSSPHGELLS
jgi:hypothetical protein